MLRRVLTAAAAIVIVAACNDSTSAGGSSGQLDGVWDWTGYYVSTLSSVACNDTGSFVFSQKDSTFAGTSQYVENCGAAPTILLDSIRGVLRGTAVTFTVALPNSPVVFCSDTAVLSTASTPTLSGIASCGAATLTWQAVRGAAVARVSVAPDSARTVVGGAWSFDAVLRSATGARLFGRHVAWSVDPAGAATIDTFGLSALVTAATSGTATVSATINSLTGSGALVVAPPAALAGASAGDARSCALTSSGAASCWGAGFGGSGYSSVPVPLNSTLKFTSVTVGGEFACGLVGTSVYCWGANESGQLGNGTTTSSATPVAVRGNYAGLSAGYRYACAWTQAGAGFCWGDNGSGQLGTGNTTGALLPQPVAGGITFASMTARLGHTCGLSTSGTLYCWGDNTFGQLGDNSTTQRLVPTRVAGSNTYASVSAGSMSTCAVSNNVAYCWGGQLGATGPNLLTPTAVGGGLSFSAVSVGDDHACGLSGTAAWCWGTNTWGQLGDSTRKASAAPVAVRGGLAFATISAGVYFYSDEGHSSHSCAVTTGGVTYCWGDNLLGQLGNGAHAESAVPVKVAGQP